MEIGSRENQLKQKPVIFIAFANDKVNYAKYLRKLSKELRSIRSVLDKARQAGLCEVVERADVTIDDILDVFQDEIYKDRIAIFHYGGHANSYQLLFETFEGGIAPAHREGLVSFFARQKGLKLIFLNACSTKQHALELIQAGIPAVIGTSQAISDEVATNLAIRFYNGIANGFSLERSWRDAVDYIKIQKGTFSFKNLYLMGKKENEDRFPWNIFFKKGAEKVKEWNLPDAVNDPLFGLPPIPQNCKLPERPFLFLKAYERKHAEIFFGRSYYIRELYNQVTDKKSPPIILLYGQSGVGKSSLLEAGLLPRLEKSHMVLYARRIWEKGLLGTLEEALKNQLSSSKESVDIKPSTIAEKWKLIESKTGMPMVFILDQVEKVYTSINNRLPSEFEDFIEALKSIFRNPELYPEGKLILSYRKEYHPEIDEKFKNKEFDRALLFLQPLNQKDIIDIVTGLTRTKRLTDKYQLEIEDQLPFIIADDLLEDKNSPVAPIIQIILTKMWDTSIIDRFSPTRNFTIEHYQELKREGVAMKDFFEQQIEKLKEWNLEVVESGLALDVLKFHTTELGTACTRSIDDIWDTYQNRLEIIDDLVKKLEDFYLLTDAHHKGAETSLAHDTLAPIVIKEYTESDKPGQRTARILATKKEDFKRESNKIWLDETDLEIVEQGKTGMRSLDIDEEKLLKMSRERRVQREKEKKRIRQIGIALITIIIISAIFAFWQWRTALEKTKIAEEKTLIANENTKKAQANYLVSQAQLRVKKDPTIALRIAEKAYHLNKNDVTSETIHKIYWGNIFYEIIFGQESNILPGGVKYTIPFSSDGKYILTSSGDGTVSLWDLKGNQSMIFKGHKNRVCSFAFSPDGEYMLTGSSESARLWDLKGNQLKIFKTPKGEFLSSVVFLPDGEYIFTGSWEGSYETVRLWNLKGDLLLVLKGIEGAVSNRVISPDGKYILILSGSETNTARLWESNGKELPIFKEYRIESAAFSPDGKYILTGFYDNTARLWDLKGNQLQVFKGHLYAVGPVAFSPDGKCILTASQDNIVRLWDLKGKELQTFRGHKSQIKSLAFSPDGNYILTGSYKTVRLWDLRIKYLPSIRDENRAVSVDFSHNNKYIFTGLKDGTARLWDLKGKELQFFSGHKECIYSFDFSPDDKYILTSSGDGTVSLWDLKGNELLTFRAHEEAILSTVFSPDGKYILTGSNDNTARLWDLKGKELQVFREDNRVRSVAFSPDCKYIRTMSWGGDFHLWDLQGNEVQHFGGRMQNVISAVFSPNGKSILNVSKDGTARLWDLEGNQLQIFKGHEDCIISVAFSTEGNYILTGSKDGTARLWDLKGNELQIFKGHERAIESVNFSPNGKYILACSKDETYRLWDIKGDETAILWDIKGNKLQDFKGYNVAFSPDGKYILTGSKDNIVRLWDLKGKELQTFKGHKSRIKSLAFSPDGNYILTVSFITARLWDLNGNQLQVFKGHTNAVTFSPDGKYILTGSNDNTARLWDLKGKELQTFKGHKSSVISVAFSQDGKYVLTGSTDYTARLWELSGKELKVIKGQSFTNSVAFSQDGKYILTKSGDESFRVWDLQGNEVQHFGGHKQGVTCAIFSPDGKYIVNGSQDGTIRLWSLKGNKSQLFKGHEGFVRAIVYSPDGKYILTCSDDRTARLWNLKGKELKVFKEHERIYSIVFSPDGRYIFTLNDKTVNLWDLIRGKRLQSFREYEDWVHSAAFLPDGKYVLTRSRDGNVCIRKIMPLEDFLKNGICERLSEEQLKEYGIEN